MCDKGMKKMSEKQLQVMRERREYLRGLSRPLQELVRAGELESVNAGLVAIYAEQGHRELRTIRQWNELGKRVKRGERALLLWGKPTAGRGDGDAGDAGVVVAGGDSGDSSDDDVLGRFFPMCYVFSAKQVEG